VVFKISKGYRGRNKNVYKLARDRVHHALLSQYRDRKLKKRNMRRLFQLQVNAGTRQFGMAYSQFTFGLQQENIRLNRKILADLAVNEPYTFKAIVDHVKDVIEWKDVNANRIGPEDVVAPPVWGNEEELAKMDPQLSHESGLERMREYTYASSLHGKKLDADIKIKEIVEPPTKRELIRRKQIAKKRNKLD